MHDVDARLGDPAHDMPKHRKVTWMGVPAHRNASEAESERRLELSQDLLGACAAGVPVGDQANPVPAGNLLGGEVEYVAEQTADRRTEYVQDIQGRHLAPASLVGSKSQPIGGTFAEN